MSQDNFRNSMLKKVFAVAGVEAKDDALRHSSISYYLAKNSGTQVRQVAEWAGNSEAIIQTYYLQYVSPEEGEKWFAAVGHLIRK
jgi:hypothetical protein